MPLKPVSVEARDGYKIWLSFNDGVEGEIDVSDVAHYEWFKPWCDRRVFENVRITSPLDITWNNDSNMTMCTMSLYAELTGTPFDDVVARVNGHPVHA